jgi:DNA-binding MarR family transcriptional regulator
VYTAGMPRSLPFLYAAEELSDALTERLAPVLAEAELTATQFSVLYLLVEGGPMTPSALADQQRCVKSNASYLVRTMQRDGLIELASGQDDQRTRRITPTRLGRKRYAVAKAGVAAFERALAKALGGHVLAAVTKGCLETARAIDSLS